MKFETFSDGETIFNESDRSESAYVIESGQVAILDGVVTTSPSIAKVGSCSSVTGAATWAYGSTVSTSAAGCISPDPVSFKWAKTPSFWATEARPSASG